jgi:hypothetical protein
MVPLRLPWLLITLLQGRVMFAYLRRPC